MDELQAQVEAILGSRRIKHRLVVLCEGDRLIPTDRAPSPQMYRALEKTPDSNFYKACVPTDWHGSCLPHFFNCGGRAEVLRSFDALLEAHHERPEASYLSPDKLYALVDLDLQLGKLPNDYPWPTTEEVHAALYEDGAVCAEPDARHRIWVTALVHKEAFFVLSGAAASWAHGGVAPFFAGAPLELRALHAEVARRLESDPDFAQNLARAQGRLARFSAGARLDCSSSQALARSWQTQATNASDEDYEALLRALLAVAKVKPLWSKVVPDPRVGGMLLPDETFREQLALNIARSIAKLKPSAHPLAGLFAWLAPRRY